MGHESRQQQREQKLQGIKKSLFDNGGELTIHKGPDDDYDVADMKSSSSSSLNAPSNSSSSKGSSEELEEDASSSSISAVSSQSNEAVYDLSQLMLELPIKRGLSEFYKGKSQSFTSLARVISLEDLAKKTGPRRSKFKACKSYGGGLSNRKSSPYSSRTLPKPTISKKPSRASLSFSLSCLSGKSSSVSSAK
ncbi:hypothetical protein Dimus_027661 [Dionaea muscipula]